MNRSRVTWTGSSYLRRYATAIAAVAIAAALEPVVGSAPGFPLFFVAVALASWHGGLGPGLVAGLSSIAVITGWMQTSPELGRETVRFVALCLVATATGGLAESRRRILDSSREAATRVSRLREITAALSGALTRDQVADAVGQRVLGALDAGVGIVGLVEDDGRALRVLRVVGLPTTVDEPARLRSLGDDEPSPLAEAVRSRVPVLVASEKDELVRGPHLGGEMAAQIVLPLVLEDRAIGVLAVGWRDRVELDADEIAFLTTIATLCAQAMERARLYEIEQDARRQAEWASRMKDEFLATISHELRTPLTAMLGWARLLREGQLDESKVGRAIETIERNTKVQAQLVEDVLDVSRIINGKLRLDLRPLDPRGVVEAAMAVVRPTADAKGIHLLATLENEPFAVSGDPDRLQQVVWNLLSNATRFTPEGGTVEVRVEHVGSRARISVRDTGQGISPAFLPFVFDRFRQADGSSTRVHGGLGLGLAIVRHLVELHGGSVRAESAGEGRGSLFEVELPVVQAKAVPLPVEDHRPVDPSALDGLRILVVDDDVESLDVLTAVLVQFGAQVKGSASAREALEDVQSFRPDVLLSDIAMPGEDGYSLIRRVRSLSPERGGEIPAAAITAFATDEDRVRALSAGYQTHLPKPFEPSTLAAVVTDLARRPLRRAPVATS
ncbi:MAG: response regulator [Deltaproteobacteria bacterium]|nr:response regulator [Deltaproteobacteria bacterium]